MFNTPILYIIFNRLDTVKQTFPVIKKQQPKQLFIAADGPRIERCGESEKCKEVREWVLTQIDWDCELKTLFREENLGCGQGPATAITWFFDNVEQGIILEDDCLPSDSFFKYCEELLNYYKDDRRIMQISGTNRLGFFESEYTYFFTNYPSEWGWATWKRAWKLYDFIISSWRKDNTIEIIKDIFYTEEMFNKISNILDETKDNIKVSWWDYQWGYIKNINSGLSITPYNNLISNIGFDENATHTFDKNNPFFNIPKNEICFPIIHPNTVYKTIDMEKKLLELNFPKNIKTIRDTFIYKILKKIYRIIKWIIK